MRWRCASVLALLAAGGAGSTLAAATKLSISGTFHTTTARVVFGTSPGCGLHPKGTLIYESAAMRIGRSRAVARVEFLIRRFGGRGRYDATASAPYGRTAVQVVTGRNATTGVATRFYIATSGSVTITKATNVRRLGHVASLGGSVHATLRPQRAKGRLALDGTWHCRIPPEANRG